jgi:GWxTD domain-containing protein
MRVKLYAGIFSLILIIILFQGCSYILAEREIPYKDKVQNDMYIIMTSEQYNELENQKSDNDINNFIAKFWKDKDTELKDEYIKRLKYANQHFPDKYGWGRSARKRIYITYGPPLDIDKTNFADIPIDKLAKVKSIEVWYYLRPGKNNSLKTAFTEVSKGEMKFVFADMIGSGVYDIIDSTEDPDDIDSRIFQ